ncbi:hypothetical protein GGR51DRAFT_192914 [Nemania sp. FL0031]|nr:hypothetical protein GGR51DRAFT_192914 [Nemania sp. FL0031]
MDIPALSVDPFGSNIRAEFYHHLQATPSDRRIGLNDKAKLITWLTDPNTHPTSQKEFSRRNYVRKNFIWDDARQELLAIPKQGGEQERVVITENLIVDVVWSIHTRNGHAGWDTTWRDVSRSYYGILRTDVIFLLQRCDICARDPRKRPKGTSALHQSIEPREPHTPELLKLEEFLLDPTNSVGCRVDALI